MPASTKKQIAEAAMALLMKQNTNKLTVKNIVEECNITRQAFYYHFEDIPQLFRWILEQGAQKVMEEVQALDEPEQGMKYFFLMAINALPYIKKSMESNYRDEFELLLTEHFYHLFDELVKKENLYQNRSRWEVHLILRYHSHGIMGLLHNWTEEDTRNLDQIVHLTYLLVTEGISPIV